MPLDSASYIERSSDRSLFEGLKAGQYCYVLNSRQMGKSSLSVRVLEKLKRSGVRTALVDLTRIGGKNVTAAQWYAGLCDAIGVSLGLQEQMLDYFRRNTLLSPMQRFFGAIENVAMTQILVPIAVFIDENDSTKNLSFQSDEFFAGIRECFNRRFQDERFYRLSFCLIGVAVPTDLISNPSTTPFNIGERIQLSDFTLGEMRVLAEALGPNGRDLVERNHYWTGGQPFISQSLCEAVVSDLAVQTASDVDNLVRAKLLERRARTTNINLGDVGDRTLNSSDGEQNPERFRASLLATYERAWRGGFVPDDESNRHEVILKLSGIVRSDGHRLVVRNRIYREVFDKKWVEDNVPERELLRERQAFRRVIVRAGSASATVLAVVCALGLLAWKSENDAVNSKRKLDYQLYVSDINNLRLLEESGDVARIDEILDTTRSSPYRGFEWGYWLGRIHGSSEEFTLNYSAPGKREEGLVSQDGKQVCVFDSLAGIAAIIDRKSRKAVAVRQLTRRAHIVATRAGFTFVEDDTRSVTATRIVDGKRLSRVEVKTSFDGTPVTRPRSSFTFALIRNAVDDIPKELRLWDLADGTTKLALHTEEHFSENPLAFNSDGSRFLFRRPFGKVSKPGWQHWVVFDTNQNREIDSFDVPTQTACLDFSDSGRLILFRDAQRTTLCRDVTQHQTVCSRLWDGGDISTGAWITGNDQSIAQYFGNGRANLVNLATGRTSNLGNRVWSLVQANSKGDFVAAATSVRIVNQTGEAVGSVIGQGARVFRDDRGGGVLASSMKSRYRLRLSRTLD